MKQGNQKKPPFWVRSKSGTQNAWIAFVILGAIGVFFSSSAWLVGSLEAQAMTTCRSGYPS